ATGRARAALPPLPGQRARRRLERTRNRDLRRYRCRRRDPRPRIAVRRRRPRPPAGGRGRRADRNAPARVRPAGPLSRPRRRRRPVRGAGRRHRPDALPRRQRLVGRQRPVRRPHRVPPVRPHQPGARGLVRWQGYGPDRWRMARPAGRRTIPRRRVLRLAPGRGRGRVRLARHRRRARAAGMRALTGCGTVALALAALAALMALTPLAARETTRAPEPNTRVPAGVPHYTATVFPDRIVA